MAGTRHRLPLFGESGAAEPRRRFCAKPFQHLEVVPDGRAFLCCSGWLPFSVGNIRYQSVAEIWNGSMARTLRRSILDDSFAYCGRCPFLKSVTGPVRYVGQVSDPEERALLDPNAEVAHRVKWLNLAYDRTCNLSCPSCRTEVVVTTGEELDRAGAIQNRLLDSGLLPRIDWLSVTGSGDPFASRLFRNLLRSIDPAKYPRLNVKLHTNGLLFTPDAWVDLGHVRSLVRSVEVSIDAAQPATYLLNRRGGSWDTLLHNLAFIASLRRLGPVDYLQLSFVVQANNWREMPDFVDIGQLFGADHVYFSSLRDWGTFSSKEYASRAIQRVEHPDHAAFLASLGDERLSRPHVMLGDLKDDP